MYDQEQKIARTQITKIYTERPQMFRAHPVRFMVLFMSISFGIGLTIRELWSFAIPALAVGFVGFGIWYLAVLSTKLTVTSDSVRLERGILAKNYTEVRVPNIRTVEVRQGLLERITDVGRIQITTMGDFPEIEVFGMPRPGEVESMVRGNI